MADKSDGYKDREIQLDLEGEHYLCLGLRSKKVVKKEKRRKVDLKVPKRITNSDDIETIATHLGNDWRRLGTKLGFGKGELDTFEYDHHVIGLHEIIYQMLLEWRERKGIEASVKVVASELIGIKRPDIVKQFTVK